jgi:hypothetical protein
MGTENYDDSAKGGYSYAEKLQQVALGNMDPKEIGMASQEDAQLKIEPKEAVKPKIGTTVMFRAGAIPMELRVMWARQQHNAERKIISAETDFDEAAWIEANKNEYPIQGDLICGQAAAKFQQTFKDPVLGLCQMLKKAGAMLEAKYMELDAEQNAETQQQDETSEQQKP